MPFDPSSHYTGSEMLCFRISWAFESVILCILPEDLEEVIAAVRNRDNEVYYIKELSKGNVNGKQLKCLGNE